MNSDKAEQTPAKKLLIWSAADQSGIERLSASFSDLAEKLMASLTVDQATNYLDCLAHTLCDRRSMLSWRSFAIVGSLAALQEMSGKLSRPVRCSTVAKLGYVFTGQGAQYAGMARELLRFPVFRNSLHQSEMFIGQLGCRWSLTGKPLCPNCFEPLQILTKNAERS